MERPKKLSATFVKTISAPGRYGDGRGGHGLSLLVKPSSTGRVRRIWCQRLRIDGKAVDLGLGSFPVTTLAEARTKALANRRSIEHGQEDPRTKARTVPTFSQAVETVIDLHQANWKNPRVAGQWRASMKEYALPKLGRKTVAARSAGVRPWLARKTTTYTDTLVHKATHGRRIHSISTTTFTCS